MNIFLRIWFDGDYY